MLAVRPLSNGRVNRISWCVSPIVLRVRGYRFYFFSREEPRPYMCSMPAVKPSSGWSGRWNWRLITDSG